MLQDIVSDAGKKLSLIHPDLYAKDALTLGPFMKIPIIKKNFVIDAIILQKDIPSPMRIHFVNIAKLN